jgi:UPF0148 protein
MSNELTKKAAEMLLNGATLLSEPCPYCKGVRVMKDGNALCVNCGKEPEKSNDVMESNESKNNSSTLTKLEEKLEKLTGELSEESNHEKQESLLRSINSLVEIIKKMKN